MELVALKCPKCGGELDSRGTEKDVLQILRSQILPDDGKQDNKRH